ncbi:YajG family lipoprotein [Pseudoalteromonas umbrosa]|uniref:YajG family lipoprotein n=1 Tax=Pseudoalteromonas umbrosa TaxID=3048489 RepID=UPI0024C2E0E4|nr:YajG family lipoprotein [Pseudoalteromonas sp. B95]MDK1287211.1 YajG family lipoprotein [Pseudoalteromonas sp. B95]
MAKIIYSLATAGMLAVLSGCTAAPKSVIMNPQYSEGQVVQFNMPINVNVMDLRTSKFTVKVLNTEPAVYLPDANLPVTISNVFKQALVANNANITPEAKTTITLEIDKFLAQVTETYSKHESNAEAEFKVTVNKPSGTFSKSYTGTRTLSGSLKHDQAKVEGQLNMLAQQLVTHIIKDKELIDFIAQQ